MVNMISGVIFTAVIVPLYVPFVMGSTVIGSIYGPSFTLPKKSKIHNFLHGAKDGFIYGTIVPIVMVVNAFGVI